MQSLALRLTLFMALLYSPLIWAAPSESTPEPTKQPLQVADLMQYVPADAWLWLASEHGQQAGWRHALARQQPEQLKSWLVGLQAEASYPGEQLLWALMADLVQQNDYSSEHLQQRYGLAEASPMAIYSQGLLPVLRLELSEPDRFWQRWQGLAAKLELPPVTTELGGQPLHTWLLAKDDDADILLALQQQQQQLVVAVLLSTDNRALKAERLGWKLPKNNAQAEWAALGQGLSTDLRGRVHLQQLGAAALMGQASSLRTDLNVLSQRGPGDEFNLDLPAGCALEYQALIEQAPKLVFGHSAAASSRLSAPMRSQLRLDLSHVPLRQALQAMQGPLPTALSGSEQVALSVDLGLNVGPLLPKALSLWQGVTKAKYQCPALQQWQAQAQAYNPLMLAVMANTLPGLQAAGLRLLPAQEQATDADADAHSPFWLGLTANNPSRLLPALTGLLPELASTSAEQLAEGHVLRQASPWWPAGSRLGINGKQLALYQGAPAEHYHDLRTQAATGPALLSLSLEPKLLRQQESALLALPACQAFNGTCEALLQALEPWVGLPNMAGQLTAGEQGLLLDWQW